MNDYQQQQWDALQLARGALGRLSREERKALESELVDYLQFRRQVDLFLQTHFSKRCTASCYRNRRSACCSKDGIITFWADVVINLTVSDETGLAGMERSLTEPLHAHKCTYLGRKGCLWGIRPLGCTMFLCDDVQDAVFGDDGGLQRQWALLNEQAKGFRWPDRPVLFDRLETFFMARGCRSPIMYINTSPGLIRIKKQAGLPMIPA